MSGRKRSLREARHVDKFAYIGGDDRFYEQGYSNYRHSDEFSSIVQSALDGHGLTWEIQRVGVWSHVVPAGDASAAPLPTQGWKIHVSANESNCKQILTSVAALAAQRRVQFKFANDLNTMKMMTSKRWPRGGSGKFITIYPLDEAAFVTLIEALYQELRGFVGSYILSDKRYKDCRCLYYRYGGIIQVTELDYMGLEVPVLTTPDGRNVPDKRNPYFELPPWVEDPFPDTPEDDDEMTLGDGRFSIDSALGFSNTGGVYLATDTTTGKEVVIKEARPHVELAGNGQDATDRLAREMRNLQALSPLGVCPAVLGSFHDWENFYVVEERLDAIDMREVMLKYSPLMKVAPTLEDGQEFYDIYMRVFGQLLAAVDTVHGQGYVIGDLSPPNVLVGKEDFSVRLIDLEAAFRPEDGDSDDIHTLGFRSPVKGRAKESSFEDDRYAVAAIMMYSMFPIVAMAYLRDDMFANILPVLIADIGWKDTPVQDVIVKLADNRISLREAARMLKQPARIEPPYAQRGGPLSRPGAVADRLARFLVDNCRTDTDKTLFPVDPFTDYTNTVSLGFGTTGVVYAMLACGHALPEPGMERFAAELAGIKPGTLPPGFITGLAGIGWACLAIGRTEDGLRLIRQANESPLLHAHHSLYYGMAGIGLANLAAHRASGDAGHLDMALALGAKLLERANEDDRGTYWEDDGGIRIGYGYGQAGVALFLLRLGQVTGDARWRERGLSALRYDLSYAFELEKGILTFPCSPEEVNTYEPYVEQGTAGIAKVAIRYGLWDEVDRLLGDTHRKYAGFPGMIYGLGSLLDVMVDAYAHSGRQKYLDLAQRPYQGIHDLYVFGDEHSAAVPGDNLFRISCDYGTGVAGVMRALHRLEHPGIDTFCLDELDAATPGTDDMRQAAVPTATEMA